MLPLVAADLTALKSVPILGTELIPVVAPEHPLAALDGPIDRETLHRHIQFVLTDASDITTGRDHGVLSSTKWRLADLGAKKAMLLAGLR